MKPFACKETSNDEAPYKVTVSVMHTGKDDFWPLLFAMDNVEIDNGFIIAAQLNRDDDGLHCMSVRGFDRVNSELLCVNSYGPEGVPIFYQETKPLKNVRKDQIKFFAHL